MTHTAALALATSRRAAALPVIREKIPTAAAVGDLESATAQTVEKMCEYIDAGTRDSIVRNWAERAGDAYGRGATNTAAKAWGSFWLAKHAVEYAHDEPRLSRMGEPGALDLLIAPAVLVRMRKPKEDCDGFTMLICSLLRVLGVECYIVTVAADPSDPSRWSHVFALAKLEDGTYMPLDGSHGAFPGWMVPAEHIFRWQAWGMNGRAADDVKMPRFQGLHGYARRGSKMRRGMGDCLNAQVNMGVCPDGSTYTGILDSGGAAPAPSSTIAPLTFPYVTNPTPAPAPAAAPASSFNWDAAIASLLGQGVGIAKGVLAPTYQQTCNAAGVCSVTENAPTTAGIGVPVPGLGSISPTFLLVGAAVLVGLVVLSKGK